MALDTAAAKPFRLAWSACRNEHALKKKARPRIQADSGPWKRSGRFGQCPDGVRRRARLFAFRVAAVAAEVAARRVFELAVAFGALTDERVVAVGLDAVGHAHGYYGLLLLVGERARRVGLLLQSP